MVSPAPCKSIPDLPSHVPAGGGTVGRRLPGGGANARFALCAFDGLRRPTARALSAAKPACRVSRCGDRHLEI